MMMFRRCCFNVSAAATGGAFLFGLADAVWWSPPDMDFQTNVLPNFPDTLSYNSCDTPGWIYSKWYGRWYWGRGGGCSDWADWTFEKTTDGFVVSAGDTNGQITKGGLTAPSVISADEKLLKVNFTTKGWGQQYIGHYHGGYTTKSARGFVLNGPDKDGKSYWAMVPDYDLNRDDNQNHPDDINLMHWDGEVVAKKNDQSLEMWFECDDYGSEDLNISVDYLVSSDDPSIPIDYWRTKVHIKSKLFCWHSQQNCKKTGYGLWERTIDAVYVPGLNNEGCPCSEDDDCHGTQKCEGKTSFTTGTCNWCQNGPDGDVQCSNHLPVDGTVDIPGRPSKLSNHPFVAPEIGNQHPELTMDNYGYPSDQIMKSSTGSIITFWDGSTEYAAY